MRHRLLLSSIVGLALVAATTRARAGNIFVTSLVDKISSSGGCSLQEAIYAANRDSQSAISGYDVLRNPVVIPTPQCNPGGRGDVIILPTGGVFSLSKIVDDADNPMGPTATPVITSAITIEANGSTLRWDGPGRARLFSVDETGQLTIRNAYIKGFGIKGGDGGGGGGGGLGAGGAIYVKEGTLRVDSSTFESNSAIGGNGSTLLTFASGTAGGGGGGLSGNGSPSEDAAGPIGGGGGGGSRADGAPPSQADVGVADGGGGGGTVRNGFSGGGLPSSLNPFCVGSGADGGDGGPGGGGGGGESAVVVEGCFSGGDGGRGGYGGGGGGGGAGYSLGLGGSGSGGDGGSVGGGGGAGGPDVPPTGIGPSGGNGGFGGGGGAAHGGYISGGPGQGGTFGGKADEDHGGGGGALGGAIFNDGGSVTILNSTFGGNSVYRGVGGGGQAANGADAGGAIFSRNGILEVIDSTISGNLATGSGGAIVVVGDGATASFTLNDSIVYANGAQECFVRGSVATAGVANLIGGNGGGPPSFAPCPGAATGADPQLGPLQLNFPGSTPTMAIPQSSPAWNAADSSTSLALDQRTEPRPSMGGSDIGAFELCIERFGPLIRVCPLPPVNAQTELLTIAVSPAGSGTTNPPEGQQNELLDSVVVLSALPNPGYVFHDWTGNVTDPTSASTTVLMNNPQTVTANFVPCPDSDGDSICDDGDQSGTAGDHPCASGATTGCDDNCVGRSNPLQEDGDGVGDACDNCPFYASANQTDRDGDHRGDVCECTDQNGDGFNTVSDLVAINLAIFNPAVATPLCDGNNDGRCDVNDIIAANVEIFSPGNTSTCARQPVPGP